MARDRVEQRAYEIWEEEGRPEGRAHHHWLRAEAELDQGSSDAAAIDAAPALAQGGKIGGEAGTLADAALGAPEDPAPKKRGGRARSAKPKGT